MMISAPTGDSGDFAGERSAVFAPSIAADYRYRIFFAGLDVGARLRPVTEFAGARVGSQITTGLGGGFDVIDRERLSVMAEARGSFFGGGGGPIPIGDAAITVPRFRFVLGATYAPTARDSDGDGIIDKNDFCPNRAGTRTGERPGCPSDENEEKKP